MVAELILIGLVGLLVGLVVGIHMGYDLGRQTTRRVVLETSDTDPRDDK